MKYVCGTNKILWQRTRRQMQYTENTLKNGKYTHRLMKYVNKVNILNK